MMSVKNPDGSLRLLTQTITVTLNESQRQAVLMALAHLAIERPGWRPACLEPIALLMDNQLPDGRPQLFTEFLKLHHDTVRDSLPEHPTSESLNKALAKYDNSKL
jgi:hypothetical protein